MPNQYRLSNDGTHYLCLFRKGGSCLIDRADYPLASKHTWYLGKRGYALTHINRKAITLHRFLMSAVDGMDVDHISGDKLDNRRQNLRVCTHQQNMHNQKLRNTNTSGYTGVSFLKNAGRYEAYLHYGGHKIHLGLFSDPREAAIARDREALVRCGEYARLNFPRQKGSPAYG